MLEVIFLTSNNVKLAHARYLCRNYSVYISKQKHYGVSYREPRIYDRQRLLKESIEDAYERLKKYLPTLDEKIFFIEDTSVIIPAFSNEFEFPGVDVKYWMQENDFSSIDKKLKEFGNDRRAIVRSDIALMLPQDMKVFETDRLKVFTSCVSGDVASREIPVSTNLLYPWLDNKTFNKWFIPSGCGSVLSLLPIYEADKYDFRGGAFKQMLELLEKYDFIQEHDSRTDSNYYQLENPRQRNLFEPDIPLFIVCGYTCAGKTTIADYLTQNYNYYHIEASDYMYLSYYRTHGAASNLYIGDFAEEALKTDPGIVVNQIIQDIEDLVDVPIIITGLRSPDEIEIFKKQYRGNAHIKVVFIDADQNIRFERSINRSREDIQKTEKDFKQLDQQQEAMGLGKIKALYSNDNVVTNDSSFEAYYEDFERNYDKDIDILKQSLSEGENMYSPKSSLEDEIILSLLPHFGMRTYFTTTEIAKLINQQFYAGATVKSKNNVSRYFNQYFYPYYEINVKEGKKRFRLSQSGVGHARWLLRERK